MTKAGTDYQELVGLIARALEPRASIKTGQWVEGPDGDREVDVEVRGTIEGQPHFVLVECKDWQKPVDIQEIDKLDSKRSDLAADAAIIYSNSGYTKKALRKAERIGIDAVSALAAGNSLVRPVVERELVAKRLSVDSWSATLFPADGVVCPEGWDVRTLRYDGLPVVNWLSPLSADLLRKHDDQRIVVYKASLKHETVFTLRDATIVLRGLQVRLTCSRTWLSQRVREDVTLGVYDHIKRRVIIPNEQGWLVGSIDSDAWEPIVPDDDPNDWVATIEPGTCRLDVTLITRSYPSGTGELPRLMT